MAKIDVPYLVAVSSSRGKCRYYWQPSSVLRKLGWKPERLPDNIARAIERAKFLNARLEDWRKAQSSPTSPTKDFFRASIVRPGTVADLICRYRESRFYKEKEPATRRGYDQNLKIIQEWAGDDPATDIDAGDVQDLYEKFRKKTPAKAAAVIRMLRILMQCAVRFDMRSDNPAIKPGLESAAPSGKLWPYEAVQLFVKIADQTGRHSVGTAVLVNWWIGQREGDVLRLQRNQYRDGRIWVKQNKTKAKVAVPHSPRVAQRIEEEMKRLDARKVASTCLIVHEGTALPYNEHTFRHEFAEIRALAAAEKGVFTLDDGSEVAMTELQFMHLRHTAVTELAISGATVPQIAAITGHTQKSVEQILDRYLVRNSELADAAVKKRLEREQSRT